MHDRRAERIFARTHGPAIALLQQLLPLSLNSCTPELRPFCELPSLFQLSGPSGIEQILRGQLLSLSTCDGAIQAIVRSLGGLRRELIVPETQEAVLSVWRFGTALEALQLNYYGQSHRLYLQTGGKSLLSLMDLEVHESTAGDTMSAVRHAFVALATEERPVVFHT